MVDQLVAKNKRLRGQPGRLLSIGYLEDLKAENKRLRADRDLLVENLIAVRDAVWKTEMNGTLQRFNEDKARALDGIG